MDSDYSLQPINQLNNNNINNYDNNAARSPFFLV
jgi:hypothetical protein